jgi:hypothetical protein
MTGMQNSDLDDLLALAATHPPEPSPALMDRVLADALALQPQPRSALPPKAAAVTRSGFLSRLAAMFGGPAALAGVTSAALFGVALGYLDPTTMDILALGQATEQAEAVEMFPSVDFLMTEG